MILGSSDAGCFRAPGTWAPSGCHRSGVRDKSPGMFWVQMLTDPEDVRVPVNRVSSGFYGTKYGASAQGLLRATNSITEEKSAI